MNSRKFSKNLDQLEYDNFQNYINKQKISFYFVFYKVLYIPFDFCLFIIQNFPGSFGIFLRYHFYKLRLNKLGYRSIIDTFVKIDKHRNLSVGELSWIDSFVSINNNLGKISIGDRCHIGQFVTIGVRANIKIGDRVGIASGTKIYSGSQAVQAGKFLAGPMIPEKLKAIKSGPVIIEDDVMIGANTVVLPGVRIGTGAVIGANSIICEDVEPWTVVIERGKKIFKRSPLSSHVINELA